MTKVKHRTDTNALQIETDDVKRDGKFRQDLTLLKFYNWTVRFSLRKFPLCQLPNLLLSVRDGECCGRR